MADAGQSTGRRKQVLQLMYAGVVSNAGHSPGWANDMHMAGLDVWLSQALAIINKSSISCQYAYIHYFYSFCGLKNGTISV